MRLSGALVVVGMACACPAPLVCTATDEAGLADAVEATCPRIFVSSPTLAGVRGLAGLNRRADVAIFRNPALASLTGLLRVDGSLSLSSNPVLREANFGSVAGLLTVGLDDSTPVLERLSYSVFASDDEQVLTGLRLESAAPLAIREIAIGCDAFCSLRDVFIKTPALSLEDVELDVAVENLSVTYLPQDAARVIDDFGVPLSSVTISGEVTEAVRDAYRVWLEGEGFEGTFKTCGDSPESCLTILGPGA
jgi:hypothetical protein